MLSSGTEVPFGVCVWSTGNTALDFVRQLGLPLSRDGRILVDAQLAVQGAQDVYAMGDCAVNPQEPLPMIAQVIKWKLGHCTHRNDVLYSISQAAKQQAVYLGKSFNKGTGNPFRFSFMGSMTQVWPEILSFDVQYFLLRNIIAWMA